jgi:hypothetical protein
MFVGRPAEIAGTDVSLPRNETVGAFDGGNGA